MTAKNIDVDAPELRMLAQLAGVAPSRMAAAYNDPEHLRDHLTLDEMKRVQGACERLLGLFAVLTARTNRFVASMNGGR